jgi:hypothetical protein
MREFDSQFIDVHPNEIYRLAMMISKDFLRHMVRVGGKFGAIGTVP